MESDKFRPVVLIAKFCFLHSSTRFVLSSATRWGKLEEALGKRRRYGREDKEEVELGGGREEEEEEEEENMVEEVEFRMDTSYLRQFLKF